MLVLLEKSIFTPSAGTGTPQSDGTGTGTPQSDGAGTGTPQSDGVRIPYLILYTTHILQLCTHSLSPLHWWSAGLGLQVWFTRQVAVLCSCGVHPASH